MGEEIVKVLKSQDEGYLRTVKSKGRKLAAMVDLVPTVEHADDPDGDVVETLHKAGVLPPATTSRKGKGKATQSHPHHIVFVDDDDAAKHYTGPSKTHNAEPGDESTLEGGGSDLGLDEEREGEEDEYAPRRARKRKAKQMANARKYQLALLQELSARLK